MFLNFGIFQQLRATGSDHPILFDSKQLIRLLSHNLIVHLRFNALLDLQLELLHYCILVFLCDQGVSRALSYLLDGLIDLAVAQFLLHRLMHRLVSHWDVCGASIV